jgi:hypothetical protein
MSLSFAFAPVDFPQFGRASLGQNTHKVRQPLWLSIP